MSQAHDNARWANLSNWWDIEIAFYVEKRGIDFDKARTFTILRWMYHGDFRPLASAIQEGQALDQAVLNLLVELIFDNRLTLQPRRRGSPRKPERFGRDVAAALLYEASARNSNKKHSNSSDDVFRSIAEKINIGDRSVRRAVTAYRKAMSKRRG